jgi:exonuclease III
MVEPQTATIENINNAQRNRNLVHDSASPKEVANLLQLETFSVASWNLQGGLKDGLQFQSVACDLSKRKVDIGCLQETHVHDGAIEERAGGRLVCLEETQGRVPRYGLGFFIGESLVDHVVDSRLISNRIAVLRLSAAPRASCGPRRKPTTVCIVNVYAPTSQRAAKFPDEYHGFYELLERTVRECRRKSAAVIVAGDFNSKLGLRQQTEGGGEEEFMGAFGKGTRNRNGGYLANFLTANKLYAGNTHCRHSMRHRTTWHGTIRDTAAGVLSVKNQIDYVCVPQCLKRAVVDGRSYAANLFTSDHSMVVVRLRLSAVYRKRKGAAKIAGDRQGRSDAEAPNPCHNLKVKLLTSDRRVRAKYQWEVRRNCVARLGDASCLREGVQQAAVERIPRKEKRRNCRIDYLEDDQIREWSEQRKELLLELKSTRAHALLAKEQEVRKERGQIASQIQRRCKLLRSVAMEEVAAELQCAPESQRKFAACRVLRKKQPYKQFVLADEEGFKSTSPVRNIPLVEAFYESFFNPEGEGRHEAVDPWGDYTGELANPIKVGEMQTAMERLRNGRSVGPDGIPGELLKYGGVPVAEAARDAVNKMFVKRQLLSQLGEGLLIPLNKPGKQPVAKETRPITLLNTLRKALSSAVLERITPKVDAFLADAQCGFRRNRSTMDVAWTYGWLRAVSHRYETTLKVFGIDMSKAFDSIIRSKLMLILEHEVGLESSELRLIRALLASTTLRVKIQGQLGKKFTTLMGIPQGDALSPVLFVVYLEAAMREVRALFSVQEDGRYVSSDWFQDVMEAAYADDVDFICVDEPRLQERLNKSIAIFAKYNLTVNATKTERITIDKDMRPTMYKKLGSHVDPGEDLRMRISKANAAFHSLWYVWRSRTVKVPTKMAMYNALVLSILMYNVGASAFTNTQMEKMNALHRRHVRYVHGIFYPEVITTPALYARTKTRPLSEDIGIARWRCFHHALCQDCGDRRAPAAEAMRVYFSHATKQRKKRRGAPPTSLPVLLNRDLKAVGRKLETVADYEALRALAANAKRWKELVDTISSQIGKAVVAKAEKHRSERLKRKREKAQRESQGAPEEPPGQRRRVEHEDPDVPSDDRIPHPGIDTQQGAVPPARRRARQEPASQEAGAPVEALAHVHRTWSAAKQRPNLTALPDEGPARKRARRQVIVEVEHEARAARIQRLDEGLNVHNDVISGRTF